MKKQFLILSAIALFTLSAASCSRDEPKKPAAATPAPAAAAADSAREQEALKQLTPANGQPIGQPIYAQGVQIYECKAGAWSLKAPAAEFFDDKDYKVKAGWHSAFSEGTDWQPSWEWTDGSRVTGDKTKAQRAEVRADAIPWLLVAVKSATGKYDKATHIQRINTVGGLKPADKCDEAQAGHLRPVYYTAVYNFFQ